MVLVFLTKVRVQDFDYRAFIRAFVLYCFSASVCLVSVSCRQCFPMQKPAFAFKLRSRVSIRLSGESKCEHKHIGKRDGWPELPFWGSIVLSWIYLGITGFV